MGLFDYGIKVIPYISATGDKVYPSIVDIRKGVMTSDTITFVTADVNTTFISVQLMYDKEPYSLGDNKVVCSIERPDGVKADITCDKINDNTIEIPLGVFGTEVEGTYNFDIKVIKTSGVVATPVMNYLTNASIDMEGEYEGDERLPILVELIATVNELADKVVAIEPLMEEIKALKPVMDSSIAEVQKATQDAIQAKEDLTTQVNTAKDELTKTVTDSVADMVSQTTTKLAELTKKVDDSIVGMNTEIDASILEMQNQVNTSITSMQTQVNTSITEMETQVESAIGRVNTAIGELDAKIEGKANTVDVYNKTETMSRQEILDAVGNADVDLSGYATKEELKGKAEKVHKHTKADITDFNHEHSHLKPLSLFTNPGEENISKYTKLATITMSKQYGYYSAMYTIPVAGHGGTTTEHLTLNVWIKQQLPLGQDGYLYATISGRSTSSSTKGYDFYIVQASQTTTSAIYEIYAQPLTGHVMSNLTLLSVASAHTVTSHVSNQPYIDSLPTTHHTKAVDITNKHKHNKADISDFSHTHPKSEISDFTHTHTKAEITDFDHAHTNLNKTLFLRSSRNQPNSYTKLFTIEFTRRYDVLSAMYLLAVSGHGGATTEHLELNIWLKQQDEVGQNGVMHLTVDGKSNVTSDMVDFYLVETSKSSDKNTYELYAHVKYSYISGSMFELGRDTTTTTKLTFHSDQAYITELPTGRNVKAIDKANKHTHSMEDITGLELTANKVNYNKHGKTTVENALDDLITELGSNRTTLINIANAELDL